MASFRQRDIIDCGAACLRFVGAHYRRDAPVVRLRQLAGTNQRGSTALGLVEAARQLGFTAKGVKEPADALPTVPLPAIAHCLIDQKLLHYVVLVEWTPKHARVIGMPRTTAVRLPRLSWPDDAVAPGDFPPDAAIFPEFAAMFDRARKPDDMPPAEQRKFEFQTALFVRWSLFGPAKNGRNRNGYWAFAEMARRGQVTQAVFRKCYGMDWPQACAEMRAYLKPKNVGVLEVSMPHVMADVSEVERIESRDATLEEARRILGEFNRLRTEQAENYPEKIRR